MKRMHGTAALLILLLTFEAAGSSGGHHLFVPESGTEAFDSIMQDEQYLAFAHHPDTRELPHAVQIQNDPESIGRGKKLFESKCYFCHRANSTETLVGPGLKDILHRENLPVSDRPATPENIRRQLKHPFNRMPSFEHLSDEDMRDIIAYLNTL